VVRRDLRRSLHVEAHADAALVAPDREAAAAHIFAVDFEIEHRRKQNVALQDESRAAARPIQNEACDARVPEKDQPMPEQRPPRAVWLEAFQATTHVSIPHAPCGFRVR
jgi:hypothetical protein